MPTLQRPSLGTMNNNFNTAEARKTYAQHYRPIGISAVVASAQSLRTAPKKLSMTEIPAILRGDHNND